MRTKFIAPLVLVAFGSLPWSEAQAKIWIVDGYGSGDFTQIQPAIDASQDGDVILVRAVFDFPTYDTFVLSKGVMIRASDAPFTMVKDAEVYVRDIAAGKRAGISGISFSTGVTYHAFTALHVDDCDGEVVLESVKLTAHDTVSSRLLIHNCDNVSVTSLDAPSSGVEISNSYVRLSEVNVTMGLDKECGECEFDAVQVTDSHIILASATITGGEGSKGSWYGHAAIPGSDGGAGLRAAHSSVILVGPGQIRGGKGGDGGDDGFGNLTPGGNGGNGFDGESAFASRMTLLGGNGGKGRPNGKSGAPWKGALTEADIVPSLGMNGGFHPGGTFQLDLDIVDAGSLVFVFADRQGFVTVPGNLGPPLGAIPGGRFVTFFGGHLGAFGHMTLPLLLPNDPSLRGTPVNAQCAVLLDAGGVVLSNATTRVVGE